MTPRDNKRVSKTEIIKEKEDWKEVNNKNKNH
jgi:hypothetical protein